MNKDKFWQLIDTMREGCNSTDEMYRKIFHILEQLPAKEVAIILCGVPIIMEAIIGLITDFDIKADVLVSIALVAAI